MQTVEEKVNELLQEFSREKAIDIVDSMIDISDAFRQHDLEFWKNVKLKLQTQNENN